MALAGKWIATIIIVVLVVLTGLVFLILWLTGTFPKNESDPNPDVPTDTIYRVEDEGAALVPQHAPPEPEQTPLQTNPVSTVQLQSRAIGECLSHIHPDPLASAGDHFGDVFAENDQFLVVGVPEQDSQRGTVALFHRMGEEDWSFVQALHEPNPQTASKFGCSVAWGSPSLFWVASSTHLYQFDVETKTVVKEIQADPKVEWDALQYVTENTLILTAKTGGLYCYQRQEDRWVMQKTLLMDQKLSGVLVREKPLATLICCGPGGVWYYETLYPFPLHRWDMKRYEDSFGGQGLSWGAQTNHIVQGCPDEEIVRVLVIPRLELVQTVTIPGGSPEEKTGFGSTFDVDPRTKVLAVGAPQDYRVVEEEGSVYLYRWSESGYYLPIHLLKCKDRYPNQHFGSRVRFSPITQAVFVGASGFESEAGALQEFTA